MKCPDCGFRVRAKNHEEGPHHNGNKNVVTGAKRARIEAHQKRTGVKTNIPKQLSKKKR